MSMTAFLDTIQTDWTRGISSTWTCRASVLVPDWENPEVNVKISGEKVSVVKEKVLEHAVRYYNMHGKEMPVAPAPKTKWIISLGNTRNDPFIDPGDYARGGKFYRKLAVPKTSRNLGKGRRSWICTNTKRLLWRSAEEKITYKPVVDEAMKAEVEKALHMAGAVTDFEVFEDIADLWVDYEEITTVKTRKKYKGGKYGDSDRDEWKTNPYKRGHHRKDCEEIMDDFILGYVQDEEEERERLMYGYYHDRDKREMENPPYDTRWLNSDSWPTEQQIPTDEQEQFTWFPEHVRDAWVEYCGSDIVCFEGKYDKIMKFNKVDLPDEVEYLLRQLIVKAERNIEYWRSLLPNTK